MLSTCVVAYLSRRLGYCYVAKDGYLQARIEDQRLREHANVYPESYPVCKDAWCVFSRGSETRHYRTNNQGKVLRGEDKKFEKDHVGFLQDVPAQHVASYGLKWTGGQVPACQVGVDVNVALLGPLCVMKVEAEGSLSFVDRNHLRQALGSLAAGEDAYMLFYKIGGAAPVVTGKMPAKYKEALFESKENVPVGVCPSGSGSDVFEELGFRIVE